VAWPRFEAHNGDVTGFIQFGSETSQRVLAPPDARVESPAGYDGQYFWLMALSPLLADSSVRGLSEDDQEYRAQRIAYPTIAALMALRQPALIPWTLLALNVIVLLLATTLAAAWARHCGHSPLWGLAIGLTPGLVLATMRDLSDPLAVTALIGGLIAWRLDRRWAAATMLGLAVLTRETMLLGVVAVLADGAAGYLRASGAQERRRSARGATAVVAVPLACFAVWQTYATARLGVVPLSRVGMNVDVAGTTGKGQFDIPFAGALRMGERALSDPSFHVRWWELSYLGLVIVGAVAAARAVVRKVDAMSVAAALFAVAALLQVSGDRFGYTRVSAPLFACLLLVGLERDRFALAVASVTALLVVALPPG
jgi:hypothetical protein